MFTELNLSIPPVPPEHQREHLLFFNLHDPQPTGLYANAAYAYVHAVARREREPGANVEREGDHILVLLPGPVLATCTETNTKFRFTAAILHERRDGEKVDGNGTILPGRLIEVSGWLINTHAEALAMWKEMMAPEPHDAPPPEDDDNDDTPGGG